MLVLTRRVGEEILIGDHIRVKAVAVQGSKVRLGIAVPASVTLRRAELLAETLFGVASAGNKAEHTSE